MTDVRAIGRWSKLVFALAAAAFGAATLATAQGAKAVDDAVLTADAMPPKLSAFGFFTDTSARTPAARVTPYTLNTPLFSDYTDKHRYLYVPASAKIGYDDKGVLAFPVGAALIKTFGYGEGAAFKPIETRLLLRRSAGWVARRVPDPLPCGGGRSWKATRKPLRSDAP